jgi:hypothetical protein
MDSDKTTWKPVPLAIDSELKAEIERAATSLRRTQADVMRDAIRKGLPLVESGGEVIRLSGTLSDKVGELAARFLRYDQPRTREEIIDEAVRCGIRAVQDQADDADPIDVMQPGGGPRAAAQRAREAALDEAAAAKPAPRKPRKPGGA